MCVAVDTVKKLRVSVCKSHCCRLKMCYIKNKSLQDMLQGEKIDFYLFIFFTELQLSCQSSKGYSPKHVIILKNFACRKSTSDTDTGHSFYKH